MVSTLKSSGTESRRSSAAMASKESQSDGIAEDLLAANALMGSDDLATRVTTPGAGDLRGCSTHDDCHSAAIVSNLASPTVIDRKMPDKQKTSSLM